MAHTVEPIITTMMRQIDGRSWCKFFLEHAVVVARALTVEPITAFVLDELLLFDGDDCRRDLAYEIPIVGDDDHGPVQELQCLLQHLFRGNVEVIRGLIQNRKLQSHSIIQHRINRAFSSPLRFSPCLSTASPLGRD